MEAGSRKQEAGSRKQEARSRKQEAGSKKQEAELGCGVWGYAVHVLLPHRRLERRDRFRVADGLVGVLVVGLAVDDQFHFLVRCGMVWWRCIALYCEGWGGRGDWVLG